MTARRHGLLSGAVDALHYANFAGSAALVRSLATSESYAPNGASTVRPSRPVAVVVSISGLRQTSAVPEPLDDLQRLGRTTRYRSPAATASARRNRLLQVTRPEIAPLTC